MLCEYYISQRVGTDVSSEACSHHPLCTARAGKQTCLEMLTLHYVIPYVTDSLWWHYTLCLKKTAPLRQVGINSSK